MIRRLIPVEAVCDYCINSKEIVIVRDPGELYFTGRNEIEKVPEGWKQIQDKTAPYNYYLKCLLCVNNDIMKDVIK